MCMKKTQIKRRRTRRKRKLLSPWTAYNSNTRESQARSTSSFQHWQAAVEGESAVRWGITWAHTLLKSHTIYQESSNNNHILTFRSLSTLLRRHLVASSSSAQVDRLELVVFQSCLPLWTVSPPSLNDLNPLLLNNINNCSIIFAHCQLCFPPDQQTFFSFSQRIQYHP